MAGRLKGDWYGKGGAQPDSFLDDRFQVKSTPGIAAQRAGGRHSASPKSKVRANPEIGFWPTFSAYKVSNCAYDRANCLERAHAQ
jgi:hypothetical protein